MKKSFLHLSLIAGLLSFGQAAWADAQSDFNNAMDAQDMQAVQASLAAGADINAPVYQQRSAIYWAAAQGNKKLLNLLNKRQSRVREPLYLLHLAVASGSQETVQYLLDEGLKPGLNQPCPAAQDQPPLLWAVQQGKRDMAEFLLKQGADPQALAQSAFSNDSMHNLLMAAAASGQLQMVEWVEKRFPGMAQQLENAEGVLSYAARSGKLPLYQALLKKGYKITGSSAQSKAVMGAASAGSHELLRFLKQQKYPLQKLASESGVSPLHLAARSGQIEAVRFFQQEGYSLQLQDDAGNGLMHEAARSQNPELLKWLQQQGLSINAENNYGHTPLLWAVEKQNLPMVQRLAELGAQLHHRSKGKQTALQLAVKLQNMELAKALLKLGVNPNQAAEGSAPPIFYAFSNRHQHMQDLLIQAGAELNVSSNKGYTLPLAALLTGQTEKLPELLKHPLDLEQRARFGETVMQSLSGSEVFMAPEGLSLSEGYYDADKGEQDFDHYNLSGGGRGYPYLNTQDIPGSPVLHWAVRLGDLKTAKLLLAAGASPHSLSETKANLLMAAVDSRKPELIDWALQFKQDPNAQDLEGNGLLHKMLNHSGNPEDLELLEKLLHLGADPNLRNQAGNTALAEALASGFEKSADLLLQRQTDLKLANQWGQTLLMLTARKGTLQQVKYLLDAGLDPNARNQDQGTALHECYNYDLRMVKALAGLLELSTEQTTQTPESPYAGITINDRPLREIFAIQELLLAQGADPNLANAEGQTALHLAMETDDPQAVQRLLKSGAKLNLQNQAGQTPLALALEKRTFALASLLLKAGANPQLLPAGQNSLLPAVLSSYADLQAAADWMPAEQLQAERAAHQQVLQQLLNAKVDPNLRNAEGKTALEQAKALKLHDLLPLLKAAAS